MRRTRDSELGPLCSPPGSCWAMRVCAHVCVRAFVYDVGVHLCVHVGVCAFVCAHGCVSTWVCVHLCVCTFVCDLSVWVCVHICV